MLEDEDYKCWLQIYERYQAHKDSIDQTSIENIERLIFHPEIEYIRQGLQLLHSFGAEKLCRYLRIHVRDTSNRLVLKSSKNKWHNKILLERCLLELILEDEQWLPLYQAGLFQDMKFRVMGEFGYSELSEVLKKNILKESQEMVLIPAGEFWMGAHPDDNEAYKSEKPRHLVELTKDFYVGKYPVTQALWEAVTGKNPSQSKGASRPVTSVSWLDAVHFCNQLSVQQGKDPVYTINGHQVSWSWESKGYRLLTESEWEAAARGPSLPTIRPPEETIEFKYAAQVAQNFKYSGSNHADEVGWYRYNWHKRRCPSVGLKLPNDFGIYDMSGNVWEWVWDAWRPKEYSIRVAQAPIIDPKGPVEPDETQTRMLKGGCWSSEDKYLRNSTRLYNSASVSSMVIGFRLACLR